MPAATGVTINLKKVDNRNLIASLVDEPQFTNAVKRQIRLSIAPELAGIATAFYRQSLQNSKQMVHHGISGASSGITKVSVPFPSGRHGFAPTKLEQLKDATLKKKRRHIGRSSFWLDYGSEGAKGREALREAVARVYNSLSLAKVTDRTTDVVRATKSARSALLEFYVDLDFSDIGDPLDTLIRRALVEGETMTGGYIDTDGEDTLALIPILEFGRRRGGRYGGVAPERPIIGPMALRLGKEMRKALVQLKVE